MLKILLNSMTCMLVTCAFLLSPQMTFGQATPLLAEGGSPPIPARLLYEFRSEDEEVIAVGQFIKLEGATIHYRKQDHTSGTFRMTDLCDEDRKYVHKQAADQKKFERKAAEAKHVWTTINKTKPRTITKGCNKLKTLGRAAVEFAPNVAAMFQVDDNRAKYACLDAYCHICRLNASSLKRILKEININRNGMYDVVSKKPLPFMKAIASMDYMGLPYLQHVANTGTLKTSDSWYDELAEPQSILAAMTKKNDIRKAAITAIGEYEDEDACAVLVDLASVVEEKHAGQRNDKVLEALLKSLGKVGVRNGEVEAILERNEKEFPKIVQKATEQLRDSD